jgi:hypothetical protein
MVSVVDEDVGVSRASDETMKEDGLAIDGANDVT